MFHCVPQQHPHNALALGWTSANLNPGPAQGCPAADLPPHARQAGPAKESILAIYPRKTRCLLRLITSKAQGGAPKGPGFVEYSPDPAQPQCAASNGKHNCLGMQHGSDFASARI